MTTLLPGNIVYAGPVTSTEISAYQSLGHLILAKCKSFGSKILMIDAVTGKEYSAKFIYGSVVRLAHQLQKLGVKSGDVVGLSGANSIEFAITLYAILAINATAAPLNVTYSDREIEHAINLSKPKIMFSSANTIDSIAKVAKNNTFVKALVVFGTSTCSSIYSFSDLINDTEVTTMKEFVPPVADKYQDVALIVCSSGTTGLPKGVQLTHKNILALLNSQHEQQAFPMVDINVLSIIPWFHIYGCLTLIISACNGSRLVYLPRFEEKVFLGAIQKYKVKLVFLVPPLMVFLAKNPIVENYDLSSILLLYCGAAPLSRETEDQIKARIGVPLIRQGYGLSETTAGVIAQTHDFCKPGSVGTLRKGLYAKVIDPETGRVLGPNQRGELCFKGDTIMKGYIGDSKSTETVIQDGWLHSGDIGYFDDDFEFFIVDRVKELIKYKGYQVPPAEIEALLLTHPKIKDAAVIGKPDEEAGELPMAFVVKQANVDLSEEDVIGFVSKSASPAKKLRGGVSFVVEIPKNPSGKILRRVLREMINKKPNSKL